MREMKDSGIEWIGEIPADWKVIKNKYLLSLLATVWLSLLKHILKKTLTLEIMLS